MKKILMVIISFMIMMQISFAQIDSCASTLSSLNGMTFTTGLITLGTTFKDSTWWENKSDTIRNIGAVIIALDSSVLKEIWPKYLVCKYKKQYHTFGSQKYYDINAIKWNENGNAVYPCNPPDINEEKFYTDKGKRIIIDHYSIEDECGNWGIKFVAISKTK